MTIKYRKIESIAGLGGYVTPMWLSPVFRQWESNGEFVGVIDELTLINSNAAPFIPKTFRLPSISQTGPGRMCGFKNLGNSLASTITVLPSDGDLLYAGIEDQNPFEMVTLPRGGTVAIFVSTTDTLSFAPIFPPGPVADDGGYWNLVIYLPGTTFAF